MLGGHFSSILGGFTPPPPPPQFFRKFLLILSFLLLSFIGYQIYNSSLGALKTLYKLEKHCWNDIDFEKIEKMLLESSIKLKTPFYRYYKNQESAKGREEEEIEKDFFYKDLKKRHYNKNPLLVLTYYNGLKAIFKGKRYEYDRLFEAHKNLSGYNISKFLNLKIVPPTVIRKINGQRGYVQLFVENIKDYPHEYLDALSPFQKSDIYVYIYLTGYLDLSEGNLLISKKCFSSSCYRSW